MVRLVLLIFMTKRSLCVGLCFLLKRSCKGKEMFPEMVWKFVQKAVAYGVANFLAL